MARASSGGSGAGRLKGAGGADAPRRVLATNRRARHDYQVLAQVEAGLMLQGSEVRSLRQTSGASLAEGFARLEGGELWLHGVHVPALPQAASQGHEPVRPRKCLVHRRELHRLEAMLAEQGTTIVPLSLYFKGPHVKVELGVVRGRRKEDRREREKEKDARRRIREVTG